MPDLMRHLHQKFRESKAPNLRAFTRSLERGIGMLNPRGFAAGLYLDQATEDALLDWADAYAIEVSGLSEAEIREGLKRDALTRNRTTEQAIEDAILAQTGVAAAVRPSLRHVAHYDDQERAKEAFRMADYAEAHRRSTGILWGQNWGGPWPGERVDVREDDPTHLGYRGLTPRREGFGPGGFIVYVGTEYDPDLEHEVLAILNEQAAAMKGYTVFWSHTYEVTATATLSLGDRETQVPRHGWGCAPFGYAWGSPVVTAEACPEPGA